ncbi:MAG: hypothetical protein HRU14_16815 [Planctomycetes bacterium]|nr:hypothetical protein [Planctomycetota bacterium]
MPRLSLALACALTLVPVVAAQGCDGNGHATLDVGVGTLGGTLTPTLTAAPGAPFTWLVDVAPGALTFQGIGTACIAFSTAHFSLADGIVTGAPTIPASGIFTTSVVLPSLPALLGVPFYSQFGAIDSSAPGGIALSNPRSVLLTLPDNFVGSLGTLAGFGTALHRSTAFGNGRYVFVSGGGAGSLLSPTPGMTTAIYDSYTHTFQAGPNLSVARVLHTATALTDGRILITGGLDGVATFNWGDAEIFDPSTGTMTLLTSTMQGPRGGHTATRLDDGRVLITGGNTVFAGAAGAPSIQIYNTAHAQVDIFDPTTNTFTPGPNMVEKRAGHSAVKLPDGRVLVAGGVSDGTIFPIVNIPVPVYAQAGEIYDPTTNSWSPTGVLSFDRFIGNMEVLPSGNVLYCGGANGLLLSSTNTSDYWDASSSTWSSPGAINLPSDVAFAASAVLADGTVAVTGGGSGVAAMFTAAAQVVRFSETTFTWTATASLPTALVSHTITILPDDSFLLVGGADPAGVAQSNGYVWNPY